jgi:hypothetical protein
MQFQELAQMDVGCEEVKHPERPTHAANLGGYFNLSDIHCMPAGVV